MKPRHIPPYIPKESVLTPMASRTVGFVEADTEYRSAARSELAEAKAGVGLTTSFSRKQPGVLDQRS